MPDPASPDTENLSGLWHGQYSYPTARAPVPFTATLLDAGGSLSGSITEKSTLRPRVGEPLYATLRGLREGSAVRFRKTYDTEDERYQVVEYEGRLSADTTEIEGTWQTFGWSGKFLMLRPRGIATATENKIYEPT
jgi:hypothetical protein